jgi:hypothetical protein
MQSFLEWFEATGQDKSKPWLILGKGPSFAKRDQFELDHFQTLSLNHAVREQPVTVAHMIDFDVVQACGENIDRNAKVLVMPWFPHFKNRPGTENLESLVRRHTTLERLNAQGRLLWYNHSLAPETHGDSPVIQVRFFSSEAALNLLAAAGVRQVRSLGIDGGNSYSSQFQDLASTTLLSNQRTTFDVQFGEIAKILMNTGLDYAPMDIQAPVRVYVAATEAQMLAVKVLEYSIRKHASLTVQVKPLHLSGIEIPTPLKPENRPRTPFSFQRFLIPALTGYEGRAIYLDSDMQVFQDIRGLWNASLEDADLLAVQEPGSTGRRPQFSVMLLNCRSLRWDIEEIVRSLNEDRLTYEQLMYDMAIASRIRVNLDPAWNSLERYHPEQTCLLHYTDMNTQPWLSCNNPLGYLWMRDLFEAIDRKFLSVSEIADDVRQGFIRPSLVYQVEHRIEDSFVLPRRARQMDHGFVPPFSVEPLRQSSPWLRPSGFLRAAARKYLQNSLLFRASRKFRSLFRTS